MNLSEFQTEVGTVCGNIGSQTKHPFYKFLYPSAGNEDQSVINRAANRLITYAVGGNGVAAQLFPELRNSWTAGPTTANTNSQPRPADSIIITDVASTHGVNPITNGWQNTREFPVTFMKETTFGNLTKDSTTQTNWPTIWMRKGKNIFYWPTTDAAGVYVDYLRFYGLKIETVLVNPTDTFFMNVIWHDLVAKLASEMLLRMLNWTQQADQMWSRFKEDLMATMNVMSGEEQTVHLDVDNMPSHYSVYGS